MLKLFTFKRNSWLLIVLFCCVLFSVLIADEFIHRRYLSNSSFSVRPVGLIPSRKNIVYPKNYRDVPGNDLLLHYNIFYNVLNAKESPDRFNFFKFDGKESWLHEGIMDTDFKDHKINLYENQGTDCDKNRKEMDLEISDYIEFDAGLDDMARVMQRQLKSDPSFKELRPYFKEDIATQLKFGTLEKHWYKFAGSSVWLEEYGVHFMVSRVIYSISGSKRKAIMSLAYAQIFDKHWTELKDIELVMPIKNEVDDEDYTNLKFPKFLPIPFYHDPKFQKKVYYGPEDTRLFLIQNEQGRKEPMVIFNAYHRKISKNDILSEKEMKVSFEFYRSMFLAWPFRLQRGKINVDGLSNKNTDNQLYSRVVELRRQDVPRLKMQKNWTPMISYDDRKEYGYDKYMYFIYRWSKLEILKCNLNNFIEGTSPCEYEYQRKLDLSKDEVGPLRGGTEMLNLREIVPNFPDTLGDKEIWVGFPRGHIKKCGCGSSMYRPNLAVITREADKRYKLTQLSSYTSLDIEVYGWTNPNILCASRDANALISNGISGWKYHGNTDYLTLMLSVADQTNHIVHIKNLLNTLLQQTTILNHNAQEGFDDAIIDCAMAESVKFCKAYGEEMKKLDKTPPPEPDYN